MARPTDTARRTVGIEIEATGERTQGQGAMTHYLPAVELLAVVAVVVFVGTLLVRATTTDGTAAPERNEGTRLAADEPTTTDGTPAPRSGERGAISAAEFLWGQESELARCQELPEDLVRVTGRLREVSDLDARTAWAVVDSIDGLKDHEVLTATLGLAPRATARAASLS